MLQIPQSGVVLTANRQEDNISLPDSVLVVRDIHHVRERVGRQFGMAAAHHHLEAAAEQANGQALREVT